MKKYSKKNLFFNAYFIVFSLCLIYKFIDVILHHSKKEYWGITEWLINYQGGFVRRGLRGEIIYQLNKHFQFDPYIVITVITTLAFLLLVCFFIKGFVKKGYPIYVLPFVFFLGNPILSNYWMRADSMIVLIFIVIIYFVIKKPNLYLIWVNLLAMFGLLIHEIFAFICFPVLILLLTDNLKGRFKLSTSFIYSCLILLPSFFMSLMVSYFKGTSNMAFAIWNSWGMVSFPESASLEMEKMNLGAIAGIGLTIKEGIKISAEFIHRFDFGLYGPLMLLITIVAVYFILTNINKFDDKIVGCTPKKKDNKSLVSEVLFFQFCVTAPLYIIGDDYSRWIFYWITTSFVLLLLVSEDRLQLVFPNIFKSVSQKINDLLFQLFGDSKATMIILSLLVGIPLYSWTLEGTISSSSLYVVLSEISRVFGFFLRV